MEKIRFEFKCRIIRTVENGFTALENEYLIQFQDRKHKHLFNSGDEIIVVLENVDAPREEELKGGYSVIYCHLKNYLSNGIQFLDIKNKQTGFFWNYRGMITNKIFEANDLWEKDSLLRIMIHKFK